MAQRLVYGAGWFRVIPIRFGMDLMRFVRLVRPSPLPSFSLVLAFLVAFVAALDVQRTAQAADWGLTLFVFPDPARSGDGNRPGYAPGARAVTRLVIENRGAVPLADVRVSAELVGAVPVISQSDTGPTWRRDGNDVHATIATLEPGASAELPLIVELADGTERGARGTGGEARIRARVPASGETLVAEATWPIASCADAFHTALGRIRLKEFAALRAAVDASRQTDRALPGKTVLTYRPSGDRAEASAVRFAEQIARARGVDSYFLSSDIKWVSGRLIKDISIYLGQERYPGLCTGVVEWTAMLETFLERFTRRVDQVDRMRAGMEPAVRRLLSAGDEEVGGAYPGEYAPDAAEAATDAISPINPAVAARRLLHSVDPDAETGAGAALFISAYDALDAAKGSLPEGELGSLRTQFAAIARLWYLDLALANANTVSDGFSGTLEAIREAQRENCTCGS